MWRDLNKNFFGVASEIYKKALKVQILNEVALIRVVRKWISFQDRICKRLDFLVFSDNDNKP